MTKRFKKFLWTSNFWALIGFIGCGSGLYFQKMAQNGMGLWFLGLVFLGAAYARSARREVRSRRVCTVEERECMHAK